MVAPSPEAAAEAIAGDSASFLRFWAWGLASEVQGLGFQGLHAVCEPRCKKGFEHVVLTLLVAAVGQWHGLFTRLLEGLRATSSESLLKKGQLT